MEENKIFGHPFNGCTRRDGVQEKKSVWLWLPIYCKHLAFFCLGKKSLGHFYICGVWTFFTSNKCVVRKIVYLQAMQKEKNHNYFKHQCLKMIFLRMTSNHRNLFWVLSYSISIDGFFR